MIQDSGSRREFDTGAVRDIQEGKGRCDLMPLLQAGRWAHDDVLRELGEFTEKGGIEYLINALDTFCVSRRWTYCEALLEVSIHFEEGAKKYGEHNWQKGIPIHCYIDSAVRHYLKYERGDSDERHDRAFIWNILCCMWTVEHEQKEGGTEC